VNGVRVPGIPIHGPAKPEVQSIEVGINRVYAAFASNQILVFDDLHGFLDELQSYSRELDEMGEPTEKIEAKPRVPKRGISGCSFVRCSFFIVRCLLSFFNATNNEERTTNE
jgi:hypothetical protein